MIRPFIISTCLLALGCGGNVATQNNQTLKKRVSSDARDWAARLELAQRSLERGDEGYAIRELSLAESAKQLDSRGRKALVTLLEKRASLRLKMRDPGALDDLEARKRLGGEALVGELQSKSTALSALAALRHSSRHRRAMAPKLLQKLGDSLQNKVYQQVLSFEELSQDELLTLWSWLESGNAKRQALQVAGFYVKQGGREESALTRWLRLHRWWYGNRRPALPQEAVDSVPPLLSSGAHFVNQLSLAQSTPRGEAQLLASHWNRSRWHDEAQVMIGAYQNDPNEAQAIARRFVDKNVYGATERAFVAELFFRLGDAPLARFWAEELRTLSKNMPSFVLAAAMACGAVGDSERALQLTTEAAASSGDPGHIWALAAESFRSSGQDLAAIAASRNALALTAEGLDLHILYELSLAQAHLGRNSDSETTLAALKSRLSSFDRADFDAYIKTHAAPIDAAPSLLGRIHNDLGFLLDK